jgi:hypothetical protein
MFFAQAPDPDYDCESPSSSSRLCGFEPAVRQPAKKASHSNLVRFSRDGDQFHYLWAARRCLNLLAPASDLKAITIEGASPTENAVSGPNPAAEEVIDVAEYFGDRAFERASLVRYIQLKHSTQTPNKPWPPSGLENTLEGFAKRYSALRPKLRKSGNGPVLEFVFVSNRPISSAIVEAVENAALRQSVKKADLAKLEGYTGFKGEQLSQFCKLLKFEGRHDALWDQRNILFQDVSQYLPDADVDAPAQLKELVTNKALSLAADNPVIERMDVLRALKTEESQLYPAPCRIEQLRSLRPPMPDIWLDHRSSPTRTTGHGGDMTTTSECPTTSLEPFKPPVLRSYRRRPTRMRTSRTRSTTSRIIKYRIYKTQILKNEVIFNLTFIS